MSVRHRVLVAATLAAFLAVAGAQAATPTVVLHLSVTGSGSVKVTNERLLRCSGTCSATFRIRAGSAVRIVPRPTTSWKLAPWTGVCKTARTSCTLRMSRAQHVSVRFASPGTAADPIPLRTAWIVPGNWLLEVASVANADGRVLDPNGNPLAAPAGKQFVLFAIAATYKGSGTASFAGLAQELTAVAGRTRYAYTGPGNGCGPGRAVLPSHDIQPKVTDNSPVDQNQTVSGYICLEVAAGDASSLALAVGGSTRPAQGVVWFAVR